MCHFVSSLSVCDVLFAPPHLLLVDPWFPSPSHLLTPLNISVCVLECGNRAHYLVCANV